MALLARARTFDAARRAPEHAARCVCTARSRRRTRRSHRPTSSRSAQHFAEAAPLGGGREGAALPVGGGRRVARLARVRRSRGSICPGARADRRRRARRQRAASRRRDRSGHRAALDRWRCHGGGRECMRRGGRSETALAWRTCSWRRAVRLRSGSSNRTTRSSHGCSDVSSSFRPATAAARALVTSSLAAEQAFVVEARDTSAIAWAAVEIAAGSPIPTPWRIPCGRRCREWSLPTLPIPVIPWSRSWRR